MLRSTFRSRPVPEPDNGGSPYEDNCPAECHFCGSDVYEPEEHEGPVYCNEECRDMDGRAAAADALADIEEGA